MNLRNLAWATVGFALSEVSMGSPLGLWKNTAPSSQPDILLNINLKIQEDKENIKRKGKYS